MVGKPQFNVEKSFGIQKNNLESSRYTQGSKGHKLIKKMTGAEHTVNEDNST